MLTEINKLMVGKFAALMLYPRFRDLNSYTENFLKCGARIENFQGTRLPRRQRGVHTTIKKSSLHINFGPSGYVTDVNFDVPHDEKWMEQVASAGGVFLMLGNGDADAHVQAVSSIGFKSIENTLTISSHASFVYT